MGNPLKWKDNILTWSNGRLLDKFNNISYSYYASGERYQKNIANQTHTYFWSSGLLVKEEIKTSQHSGSYIKENYCGDNIYSTNKQEEYIDHIIYLYDQKGITGFSVNGKTYIYSKNILGDITEIYDQTGDIVGSYSYDVWGNNTVIVNKNNIANLNPFRYRGYYYDKETGLFYTPERYYDPEVGRWINADDIAYLDPKTISGLNLYAYCYNNPINYADSNGNWPHRIDDKGKPSEHIHLKLGKENYAWYKISKKTRDPWKNKGYEDLSKTQLKDLRKGGIPSDYLNKMSYVSLPRWQEGFRYVNMPRYREGFSIESMPRWQEGFTDISMSRFQESFSSENFPKWQEGFTIPTEVIVAGVVIIAIGLIALAFFTGGQSLWGFLAFA